VQVADLNLDPPVIIKTISTGPVSNGRADELGYDPLEHIILIATPAPTPGTQRSFPRTRTPCLARFNFRMPRAGAAGMGLPASPVSPDRTGGHDFVRRGHRPREDDRDKKFPLGNCGATGLVLGPFQLLMASCGFPIILNAIDGHIIATITQVHGGDQIWYSNGDGRLYVTSTDNAGQQSLGVIDLQSSTWLQNIPVNRGKNPTVFEANNEIFVTVTAPPAGTADTTVCAANGLSGRGCMAVYHHY